jgi:hypothetical protein
MQNGVNISVMKKAGKIFFLGVGVGGGMDMTSDRDKDPC